MCLQYVVLDTKETSLTVTFTLTLVAIEIDYRFTSRIGPMRLSTTTRGSDSLYTTMGLQFISHCDRGTQSVITKYYNGIWI
jgi:hypothetical protein